MYSKPVSGLLPGLRGTTLDQSRGSGSTSKKCNTYKSEVKRMRYKVKMDNQQ
ncbi:hypothetical protein HMPREF0083_05334 [Aneurinibacillus aneurinilyticus ATCC 12856]|uniref:Uncharacterized protein n=1 Tax=Aneurinibacillus aneurinilyticus ATCC 12856 TaxID=649747 RepID=U1Y2R7_ANEAE|nr:hypothetical protein HMPREF0083_05334 [Aneurinibacillus aneurinilyticus ATCC 12856]